MKSLAKKPRIVNKDLLKFIHERIPCLVCCKVSVAHHLTTRGAFGGDIASNCLPVCLHHHSEIHQIGNAKFAKKYPVFMTWLELAGRLDLIQKIKASPLWDREDSHAQRSS